MAVLWAEIADKNHTEHQINFLKKHLKPKGVILDLACGSGRHSIPLTIAGYNLVGLDSSSKLLRIAKRRYKTIDIVRGDIRFLPFKNEIFRAAISMDTSIGYLSTQKEDMKSIIELYRTIINGGKFLIDIFNYEYLKNKYGRLRFKCLKLFGLRFLLKLQIKRFLKGSNLKEYPSFYLIQKRSISKDSKILQDLWVVQTKYDNKVSVFNHEVRLYGYVELEEILEVAGFRVNEVFGDYESNVFTVDSKRLIIIASK